MTVRTPGTPASKIDRTPVSTPGGPRSREEKIVVTVRLRPLNKREQLAKDQVAWDCIDDHTIVYKPPPQERSAQPASFSFGIWFFYILSIINYNVYKSLFSFCLCFQKSSVYWVLLITDKVFGPASITEAVYEEGVKTVALSSLMGINGSTYPFNSYILTTFFNSVFCLN